MPGSFPVSYSRFLLAASLITILGACEEQAGESAESPFEGAWRVISMERDSAGVVTPTVVQAALVIFTDRHYSAIWALGNDGAAPNAIRWNPTDAERLARFNALIVNSGAYETSGTTLTARPIVAKTPEFIGGTSTFGFEFSGDTLTLTQESIVSVDNVPIPFYAAGGRDRIKLVRLE